MNIRKSAGPILGIMKVDSDKQALNLINDSDYGLTVSIFSESKDKIVFSFKNSNWDCIW